MAAPAHIPDLRGRRCLVTGGGTGIGAAVALGLGAQGAHVAVHCHTSTAAAAAVAEAIVRAGGTAFVLSADLAQLKAAATLVEAAAAGLGGLDVLVNNAGDLVARHPVAEMEDDFFDAILALNLKSVFAASRAAIPHLRRAGGGAIINTSSISARNGGGGGVGAYAAAKAGVSSLTRTLARELAADRIRVNAVSPGIVLTRIHARNTTPEMMRTQVAGVPMGRAGTVDECVGLYLFLASAAMSGYITGQVIEINGGQLTP